LDAVTVRPGSVLNVARPSLVGSDVPAVIN